MDPYGARVLVIGLFAARLQSMGESFRFHGARPNRRRTAVSRSNIRALANLEGHWEASPIPVALPRIPSGADKIPRPSFGGGELEETEQ